MPLQIGVLRETAPGERRVAFTPETARRLIRGGASVVVESGAGDAAFISDDGFEAVDCVVGTRQEALSQRVVVTVQGVAEGDLAQLSAESVVIGLLAPLDAPASVQRLAETGATAIAMEMVPRTTRAQRMDALSAMSTVAGYRAALLGALHLPQFFPLLTTAAGTVRPARVLVLGAGVAGLQALATARRLGAVTAAYDIRDAAREQVESVGASFVKLDLTAQDDESTGGYAKELESDEQDRQVELLAEHLAEHHVVISTALVPGRPAPRLITQAGVEGMKPGSVIVDLAAANGGNCELTRPDETVRHDGVTILGPTNLPAEMPAHASEMYARTVAALLQDSLTDEGGGTPDYDNDILSAAVVARGGAVTNERVESALAA